jgi:intracellular sulfur oxidation DsrE/DsrF family protein
MKQVIFLMLVSLFGFASYSQNYNLDSALSANKKHKDSAMLALKTQRDSVYHANMHADSVKIDKEYTESVRWNKLKASVIYPAIKGSEFSGVIPVKDPTEVPDPNMQYKLLFEITESNPDSLAKEINGALGEVARKINLHVASGIPLKNIKPVIIAHGGVLQALTTNAYYKEHFKTDNPNIKLINDLAALGTKFIGCGQAMAFIDLKKEDMLPVMKVSLTAQTVITSYQLKGYILIR